MPAGVQRKTISITVTAPSPTTTQRTPTSQPQNPSKHFMTDFPTFGIPETIQRVKHRSVRTPMPPRLQFAATAGVRSCPPQECDDHRGTCRAGWQIPGCSPSQQYARRRASCSVGRPRAPYEALKPCRSDSISIGWELCQHEQLLEYHIFGGVKVSGFRNCVSYMVAVSLLRAVVAVRRRAAVRGRWSVLRPARLRSVSR